MITPSDIRNVQVLQYHLNNNNFSKEDQKEFSQLFDETKKYLIFIAGEIKNKGYEDTFDEIVRYLNEDQLDRAMNLCRIHFEKEMKKD